MERACQQRCKETELGHCGVLPLLCCSVWLFSFSWCGEKEGRDVEGNKREIEGEGERGRDKITSNGPDLPSFISKSNGRKLVRCCSYCFVHFDSHSWIQGQLFSPDPWWPTRWIFSFSNFLGCFISHQNLTPFHVSFSWPLLGKDRAKKRGLERVYWPLGY